MNTCYTLGMLLFEGKKTETITLKANRREKEIFEEIAATTDRSLSYVFRALALRGLVEYLEDARLQLTKGDVIRATKRLKESSVELPKGKTPLIEIGKKKKKRKTG